MSDIVPSFSKLFIIVPSHMITAEATASNYDTQKYNIYILMSISYALYVEPKRIVAHHVNILKRGCCETNKQAVFGCECAYFTSIFAIVHGAYQVLSYI